MIEPSLPLTYPQQVLALGPVHYWRLGGSGPWEDSVGGATASLMDSGTAPASVAGLVVDDNQGALDWGEATRRLVTQQFPAIGNIWSWGFMFSCLPASGTPDMLRQTVSAGSFNSTWVRLNSGGQINWVGRWGEGVGTQFQFSSYGAQQDDGHPHLALITYDGVTVRLYIDAVLRASAAGEMGPFTMPATAFWFGTNVSAPYILDEVAIFDRALSAEEVAALWAAVPVLPPPQNVTATPGLRSATVSWDPPASDGGSPVTEYVVEWEEVGGV